MAQAAASPAEMIPQLEAARKLVLGDAHFYTDIVKGILPIIAPTAANEVRRWGADFLAETFASPALGFTQKEELSLVVLPTLKGLLEIPSEDVTIVKSVVQTVASIYPLVFRKCISRPDESPAWQTMMTIKSNILNRMDSAPIGVKMCCIKFVQKVVQVQTPGVISDPRRPEQNETSIALVPRKHPFLSLPILEAEASGLLDRLLNIFHENSSDPILIDATMNCVAILIRTRPAVANKIISAILNFNPLKLANSPMTPRLKVIVKSMEKTTRALLRNINRNNPNGPLAAKIDAYLVRLNQSRSAIFTDTQSLKRSAPSDANDENGEVKRIRLSGTTQRKYPPLPHPPNTLAQLFTLTDDQGLTTFDVKLLPIDLINTITSLTLQHVDQHGMEEAIGVIRARYAHLQKMQQPTPVPDVPLAGPIGIDDEDDYDPEFVSETDTMSAPVDVHALQELVQPDIALGPFELPKPPPLTNVEVQVLSAQTAKQFREMIDTIPVAPQTSSTQKLGLNRLAASANDRDGWATVMTRLATRASSGLDTLVVSYDAPNGSSDPSVKMEVEGQARGQTFVAMEIRNELFEYFIQDFRGRLNVAISWLTEEWYNDRMASQTDLKLKTLPNFYSQALRILGHLVEFLDARDNKLLIRFLSEIPAINPEILNQVKRLALDPERVNMCIMALQYLIMLRPPVRSLAIDTIEEIWKDERFKEAKVAAGKVLRKWRPSVLEEEKEQTKHKDEMNQAGGMVNGIKSPETGVKIEDLDPRKGTAVTSRSVPVA